MHNSSCINDLMTSLNGLIMECQAYDNDKNIQLTGELKQSWSPDLTLIGALFLRQSPRILPKRIPLNAGM